MYLQKEKLKIVLDIVRKLKNFKGANGHEVDLYKPQYSYYDEFKEITNKYINEQGTRDLKGTIVFFEIGCVIDYVFPYSKKKPLFVFRKKKL